MHLGTAALLKFFESHRHEPHLVLVTITATEGSTYRKPGAMMLISPDMQFEGMISGGCLEGDLLHHAADVFSSGETRNVTYDTHAGEDLVWGLGLGCNGIIHLLLQRLDNPLGYRVMEHLAAAQFNHQSAMMAVVTTSEFAELPVASLAVIDQSGATLGADRLAAVCRQQVRTGWPGWRQRQVETDLFEAMVVNIPPQPRVLICGAGPDSVPVAQAFCQLGWECIVVDHRPAYARSDRFPSSCQVCHARPEQLGNEVDLGKISAAIVMSHHLENDAEYLRQITADKPPGYVGSLGPAARRDKLQEMTGAESVLVHGPAGLDIGAELPEAIALSIAAEVHAVLNQRDGQSLTTGPVGLRG